MRFVRLALLTFVAAAPAAAQTTTGNAFSTATQAAGTGSSSSTTTSTTGGTGSGSGTSGSTSTTSTAAPSISGATVTGTTLSATASGGGVDPSNFLGGSYSNPYYQGLYSNAAGTPGQFGAVLNGTSSSSTTTARTGSGATTRTTGTTTAGRGTATGTSGAATGRGGQLGGGLGGGLGSAANSAFGGQVIAAPRAIAYTANLRFPTPVVAPAQRLADVQAVLARSSMIANPAGVSVTQDGTAFVLRGAVGSEDEARMAEGMVLLTPGVREVRNELTFPKQ